MPGAKRFRYGCGSVMYSVNKCLQLFSPFLMDEALFLFLLFFFVCKGGPGAVQSPRSSRQESAPLFFIFVKARSKYFRIVKYINKSE